MAVGSLPHGVVLSLFTGAGGLDRGLEAAGLETIACIEIDSVCGKTLEINRPRWKVPDCSDVIEAAEKLTPKSLRLGIGDLHVLAGGPPCQPFSVAGQWTRSGRRGMVDRRARAIEAMLDLVEKFLPSVILIENVVGFLHGAVSATPVIERRLQAINKKFGVSYKLDKEVVDAAEYGVPQHRRRVIAIASRDGVSFQMPKPTHLERPATAWSAIGDLEEEDPPTPQGRWAGLLPSIPEGGNYQFLTAKGGGEELFGYRTRYWSFLLKLARDRPAWTVPAHPGPSTGPFHWNNRPLSVRERMRLQSFPDDWQLAGNRAERIRQVGNATPPLLAEVVGRAVVGQLLAPGAKYTSTLTLLRSHTRAIPPATPPVPVPEHFRSLIGPKEAHPGAGLGPSPR